MQEFTVKKPFYTFHHVSTKTCKIGSLPTIGCKDKDDDDGCWLAEKVAREGEGAARHGDAAAGAALRDGRAE